MRTAACSGSAWFAFRNYVDVCGWGVWVRGVLVLVGVFGLGFWPVGGSDDFCFWGLVDVC